ncbi:NADH-quinone oxidoreductase subunit C [Streptomyces sp. CS131]|uniref:NADH-quinone oxidoreductase subunit C n=1 Tax=Streptomyces sp. CS131 TaxID=2162711 RepID=UPI000D51A081|nr:NADH-quinone oxidoreductase subunit C [Streptomyces sp. CS131]PVC82958.1 NADH-quinone oxidoreductase subunit C [Streptomyces sp. CS131]
MSDRDHHTESGAAAGAEVYDRLPDAVTDVFGDGAAAESAYDLLTVDVPAADWLTALRTARDELGCTYFDWLSAVDEPGVGFRVCAHVAALGTGTVRRLMVRTTVPHDAAVLPSAIDVYAGAAWHERETHEMFGVAFDGHPHLVPLLLPEGFEGHPLRKDFVLAARVAKAWPGAKEPGEPAEGHTGPKRRAMLPPGVPDPNEWGPLKGQLPPAAARPARAARPAADRPPRRTRTAGEGSAAQRATASAPGAEAVEAPAPTGTEAPTAAGTRLSAPATPETPATPEASTSPEAPGAPETPAAARPRRSRSASQGSASQQPGADGPAETPSAPARRSRSASQGSASQRPEPDGPGTTPARPARRSRSASEGSASQRPEPGESPEGPATSDAPVRPPRVRSTDAPWHDAQPAFDEPEGRESESPHAPSPDEQPPAPDSSAPENPTPENPTPDHPAGGDPE